MRPPQLVGDPIRDFVHQVGDQHFIRQWIMCVNNAGGPLKRAYKLTRYFNPAAIALVRDALASSVFNAHT